MRQLPLIGPSSEARSPNVDLQSTVNWYLEQNQGGRGSPVMYSFPGVEEAFDLNTELGIDEDIREMHYFDNYLWIFTDSYIIKADTTASSSPSGWTLTSQDISGLSLPSVDNIVAKDNAKQLLLNNGLLISDENFKAETNSETGPGSTFYSVIREASDDVINPGVTWVPNQRIQGTKIFGNGISFEFTNDLYLNFYITGGGDWTDGQVDNLLKLTYQGAQVLHIYVEHTSTTDEYDLRLDLTSDNLGTSSFIDFNISTAYRVELYYNADDDSLTLTTYDSGGSELVSESRFFSEYESYYGTGEPLKKVDSIELGVHDIKYDSFSYSYLYDEWALDDVELNFTDKDEYISFKTGADITAPTSVEDVSVSETTLYLGRGNFPSSPGDIDYLDGYFIVADKDEPGRFRASALLDGSIWPAFSFATAERSPDPLEAIEVNGRELWLIGTETSEVWQNVGGDIFPFAPTSSGFLDSGIGTYANYTAVAEAGTVFLLGRNKAGEPIVYAASGLSPQIISNRNIENTVFDVAGSINVEQNIEAIAFVLQYRGHLFYILTVVNSLDNSGTTFLYDVSNQQWTELASPNSDKWAYDQHEFVNGWHILASSDIVNDSTNSLGTRAKVFYITEQTVLDRGENVERIRTSPYIYENNTPLFHHSVELEAEAVPEATETPYIYLRWSDDQGNTWSSWKERQLKQQSNGKLRSVWRRLGRSRNRVYQLKTDGPLSATIVNAWANISGGTE